MRDFRNYDIYKDAINLSLQIYQLTNSFTKDERFGIISQLRRAATSVFANIAEGSYKRTEKDFSKYLYISRGSCAEIISFLDFCSRLPMNITNKSSDKFELLIIEYEKLTILINRLINKLKDNKCVRS